ncbi:MAG: flavodoxin family protein, partial [Butyrivibrio sp.]|nr:flavodoxin family protein [Butyrivibrio sp.]
MCQGKMPAAFREQYENNKSKVPNQGAHYDLMITNFDKALSHPDQSDLNALKRTLAETVAKMV